MAINSVGYDGTVNESQWSEMIKKIGSAEYGVVGTFDLRPVAVSGADRTVSIAGGHCWGHGVYDEFTTNTTIQLDSIGSGSRWDMIAVRRNWTGAEGTTSLVKVNGTSSRELPSGRTEGPGVVDDQPIALVKVTAGQSQPTAIVDLRCWAGNGGMVAKDDLTLSYLETIGASVVIEGKTWTRSLSLSGLPEWTAGASLGAIPLFGVGNTMTGGIPAAGSNFLIQTGTKVATSDGAGYARLMFPKPFPNGVIYVAGFNGDDFSTNNMTVASAGSTWGAEGFGDINSWVYVLRVPGGAAINRQHRINWIAIGW
jgi:hypothetical protein